MPIPQTGYAATTLYPVFAMSLPEAWLHPRLTRRLAKQEPADDMRLLSLVGRHQIRRLPLTIPNAEVPS